MGPAHSMIWPARRTKSYTASPTNANAIKTSVATSTSAATYSAATLNGTLANPGPAVIDLAMTVSVTTSSHTGSYNTTSAITITGTDSDGTAITDTITLTAANGGETLATTKGFATVTSIAVPAQVDALGAFTFGVLNTVLATPARRIRAGADGNVIIQYDGGVTDTHPVTSGDVLDVFAKGITWSGTITTLTLYI